MPPPFESVTAPGARAFARPSAAPWIRATLRSGRTLHEAAMAEGDAGLLVGRGPVPVLTSAGREPWAVRHYLRGGAVASALGDRYLRLGVPRPLSEARRSMEADRRGVPTPKVMAGAVYPAGLFYRADLVTEFVPDSRDLASILFPDPEATGPEGDDQELRHQALEATGHLLAWAADAGVFHTDLNAKNVLLARRDGGLEPLLLDLDRCRVDVAGPGRVEEAMLARLERSLDKLGEARGRPLTEEDREALHRGVRTSGPPAGA